MICGVVGMVRWVGGACGGGYSKTVVGLIVDRGWSGGGSFGTFEAVEVAVVSGEAGSIWGRNFIMALDLL